MRKITLLLCFLALSAQPLAADPVLPAGKPAGVRPAQAGNLVPIYGGVLFFGLILAATIGVAGSSVAPSTATTISQLPA